MRWNNKHYIVGQEYNVFGIRMKLVGIRKCVDRSGCKGCNGELVFTHGQRQCGFWGNMEPIFKRIRGQKPRITLHKGITAHISKGVR